MFHFILKLIGIHNPLVGSPAPPRKQGNQVTFVPKPIYIRRQWQTTNLASENGELTFPPIM